MTEPVYELGTVAASEAILRDLYIDLRRRLAAWAAVTLQTSQARMGYIGQHLTSVVTGYPGARTGARGRDLVLPEGNSAEIKTCTKVDQLGSCRTCRHAVASIELRCPNLACQSTDIDRKDDSKWLLSPRSEDDLEDYFDEEWFFFVLFDFADLADPRQINVRIWRVDPRSRGFAYCMVDYVFNIRPNSASNASFNLWPGSVKFSMMSGSLIYSARINEDDTITTMIFPGQVGAPEPIELHPLPNYASTTTLSVSAVRAAGSLLALDLIGTKRVMLASLEGERQNRPIPREALVGSLLEGAYGPRIEHLRDYLPSEVRAPFVL